MEDANATGELLNALVAELTQELTTISNGKDKGKLTQPERRLWIRSTFALIEAWIYVMKQFALAAHPDVKCPTITEAERGFANEQEYKLRSSGDVEIGRTKIPLEANLRFAFKLLAKAYSVPTILDVSGPEWQSFQRAVKVRDRITHPKVVSDLTISEEESADVAAVLGWVVISHAKLITEAITKATPQKSQS